MISSITSVFSRPSGYHAGYSANAVQNPSNQPGSQSSLGLMPSSVGGPSQPPYHTLQTPGSQPRPSYPQSSDPLMTHKLHQSYAAAAAAVSASSPTIRSQYSQNYMPPHGTMDSYGLSMSQPHLNPSGGHPLGAGSYGSPHQAAMMSQYTGQRLHSPNTLHTSAARHPSMPSQYSPYGTPQNSSTYHGSSASDLWSSGQTMSHLQPTPFSNFQSPSGTGPNNSTPQSSTLNSLHTSNVRSSQSFSSEYAGPTSNNPYLPNHMSNDINSAYSGPGGYPASASTQPPIASQSTSSSRSSSSSRSQQQYSYGGPTSNNQTNSRHSVTQPYQSTPGSNLTGSTNNPVAASFSHYSPYASSISYDPASQARLSPYSTSVPTSTSQSPNSPQYRSTGSYSQSGSAAPVVPQLSVDSPRRPTVSSPVGSPMPPTSHTPGPPSVGSNSTQSSSQGSAFQTGSSHHHSNSVGGTGSSSSAAPSSLQQLEQMVLPHMGGNSSNNSSSTSKSASSLTSSNYYSSSTSSTNSNQANTNNSGQSPISPQSQSQPKIFPHYGPTSSTPNSQFSYHQYAPPSNSGSNWPAPPPPSRLHQSSSANTHSLKSNSMMSPSLLHGTQSARSSKTHPNDSLYPSPAETDYTQSYGSNNAGNQNSSSSSSMPHALTSSGYSPYDSMSTSKPKNDQTLYDRNKSNRSLMDSITGNGDQITNSYHSMIQPSFGSQSMSPYGTQSRFDPSPHSIQTSQYGGLSSSELSNSTYGTGSEHHNPSMIYDPYNIDNSLGIPPHQTMSEYRESQANLQSGVNPNEYPQNDPYAANFDDYETTSKRKGKGRPKKDASTPKKERKPRQPKIQSVRGRGRGRGAKSTLDHQTSALPLGMMQSDYGGPDSVTGYGPTPSSLSCSSTPNDSMDIYGNAEIFGQNRNSLNSAPSEMSSSATNPMLSASQSNLNSSVSPQNCDLMSSDYNSKPSTQLSTPIPSLSQTNSSHITSSISNSSNMNSRSPILPSSQIPQSLIPSTATSQSSTPSLQPTTPQAITDTPFGDYLGDSAKMSTSIDDQSIHNNNLCDNSSKQDSVVTSNNDPMIKSSIVSSYDEANYSTVSDISIKSNHSSVPSMTDTISSSNTRLSPMEQDKLSSDHSTNVMDMNCVPSVPSVLPQPLYAPIPDHPQQQPLPIANQSYVNDVNISSVASESALIMPSSLDDSELIDKNSNFESNCSINTHPTLTNVSNQIDLNNSLSNNEDPSGVGLSSNVCMTSMPIVPAEKPKKQRKSKKQVATNLDGNTVIDESCPVESKSSIKRKKSKKSKSDQSLNDTSTDLEDKTMQSETNFDSANSFVDNELKASSKRKRSKKKKKSEEEPSAKNSIDENDQNTTIEMHNSVDGSEANLTLESSMVSIPTEDEKPKKPRIKNKLPKRKLPKLALKLKQNKKRRRGFGSPDNSDLEKTPPPSPSPEDESATHKRRSARNTKRQRYNDDIDLDLSDEDFVQKSKSEDQSPVMNVQLNEDTMVVEKILSSRIAKRELEMDGSEETANREPVYAEVEEFYVKYKNLSYLHCDWKTEDELEKGDRRINQKIRRYRQKKDINMFDFLDEEPFNPDYVEVDRILDFNEIIEFYEEEIEDDSDQAERPTKKDDGENVLEIIDDEIENKIKEEITTTSMIGDENKVSNKDVETIKKELEENASDDQLSQSDVYDVKKDSQDERDKDQTDLTVATEIEMREEQKKDDQLVGGKIIDSSMQDGESKTEMDPKFSQNVPCVEPQSMETFKTNNAPDSNNVDVKKEENLEDKIELIEKPKKTIQKSKLVRHYLVKWRGLSYEESTWELEDDIDDQVKIQQFWKFRNPPPKSEWRIKKKPKAHEWKKLEQSHTYKNGNTLREYQLEGVNWLSFCWHNGQNCILADEMGLGKTIQSITFIQEMVRYGIPYPYLVIAPLSTIGNWQREFETWTDLNVVTYHGSSPSRSMLQDYELYYKNEKNERIPNIYKFQVMITTFEVILTDCIELSSIKWVACIIDEAHRLKNRNCKLLEGLRMLQIEHRVLLTGTPLQNNVEELYSLLHFLEPSQFTSNENFMAEFGDLKTEAQVEKLKAILKPMMLRRLKEDVEKSLAPKEETIIEVELTNTQKKYYRAILERNFQFLSKGGTYANMPNLMNTVMELRKCCIHPFLINGAEEQIIQEFRSQHTDDSSTLSAIIQASGKLVLIDKLLPRLKENGHRVLIFSQMVRCLDILEDYLCQKRYPYERIDGRVRGNLRQAAIDRFSKPDSDRFVFLLCTRAGGLGINLTAADTVIIFDSDWNPQNDLQAQARCHRIGQKKSVKVYRLICRNTYEREMFDRASLKLGLDKAVLQSINAQKNMTADNQMTKKEIEDLLRKGAYGALMEDDAAGDKFCEEDIDMILQRRTTKIVIESEGKGSTFSKASFATSDNRTDIEIDDPNFWEKWAKKANFDVDELKNRNELIVQEPRRRTQTKRFGADDAVLDISDLDTSTDEEEAISMRTRGSRNRVSSSKKRRKGRIYDPEGDEDYAHEIGFGWTRSEFFKVEKGLLTFGWGRWDECLQLANFKRNLSQVDVEDISRVILLFSLQNYKGDEKVKSFILDLITPISEKTNDFDPTSTPNEANNDPETEQHKCRRHKKQKGNVKSIGEELETLDWAKNEKCNPDIQMVDETYRKHLLRHANKILLRIRLLSYIKTDLVGDLHEKVFNCLHVREIPVPYCQPDGEPPASWWNEEADKSLIVGVYKHGYDRYNLMRQDPALCFLTVCGPPDGAALLAEMASEDDIVKMDEDEEPETPATPVTPATQNEKDKDKETKKEEKSKENSEEKPEE
ncbi:Kismet-like protein, partial [Sarcoptes scabiei]